MGSFLWPQAEARANSLLREYLTPGQREQLDLHGGFAVRGSLGGRYVVIPGVRDTVWEVGATLNRPRGYGCLGLWPLLPASDAALATMLAIATNESELQDIACHGAYRNRYWACVEAIVALDRRQRQSAHELERGVRRRFRRAFAHMARAFSPEALPPD